MPYNEKGKWVSANDLIEHAPEVRKDLATGGGLCIGGRSFPNADQANLFLRREQRQQFAARRLQQEVVSDRSN